MKQSKSNLKMDEDYDDQEFPEIYKNKESLNETETTCDINSTDILEELLITEVRDRPCLWDHRIDLKYRGPNVTKRAWEEISEILDKYSFYSENIESTVLQKKWKNLRDTFRQKQQEMKMYIPSGSEAAKKPDKWKFYHHMEFLIPSMKYRKTHTNLSGISRIQNSFSDEESRFDTISSDILHLSQSQPHQTTPIRGSGTVRSASLLSTNPQRMSINVSSKSLSESSCLDDSSVSSSPALPSVSNAKKRCTRNISVEPQNTKQIHEADKFDNLLNEFIQPRSEEQVFCSFLQSRLERLQKKYYMRITHMILQEVMKIELEQSENQYI